MADSDFFEPLDESELDVDFDESFFDDFDSLLDDPESDESELDPESDDPDSDDDVDEDDFDEPPRESLR